MTNEQRRPQNPAAADFVREVHEDLQNERLAALWQRFGKYLIAAVVFIVLGTAGYSGYTSWKAGQMEEAGDQFVVAQNALDNGDTTKAKAVLADLENAPDVYQMLVAFQQADLGQPMELSAVKGQEASYTELALVRVGYDSVPLSEQLQGDLSDLAASNSPYRFHAREVLALNAVETGDAEAASAHFQQLVQDNSTPPGVKNRAAQLFEVMAQ